MEAIHIVALVIELGFSFALGWLCAEHKRWDILGCYLAVWASVFVYGLTA